MGTNVHSDAGSRELGADHLRAATEESSWHATDRWKEPMAGTIVTSDVEVLKIESLSKRFPGQLALEDVSISLRAGQVHGLVGQNGSGKSTLIKVLAGYHEPESGAEAWFDGEPFALGSPAASAGAGIRFIHQDLGLIPSLNVVDNLALGRGYGSRVWVRLGKAEQEARRLMEDSGVGIDVRRQVAELSPFECSMIAIVRALREDEGAALRVLVLDEPTESLAKPEVASLFTVIRNLTRRGIAVLYVSHRLDEVLDICDEITVLRDGRKVETRPSDGLDHDELVRLIVGRAIDTEIEQIEPSAEKAVLEAKGLFGRSLADTSLSVRPGEILGLAGLVGSGREELPYLLGGGTRAEAGEILVEGERLFPETPRSALEHGVVLVGRDRGTQTTIPTMTVRENVTLTRIESKGPIRWLGRKGEQVEAQPWIERSGVVPPDPERLIATLSGGNQQKVVLARAMRSRPKVLVLDEPVQGVDIGARVAIFRQLVEIAETGVAIIVSSSEPEDLAAICHRILIFGGGRVVSELSKDRVSADQVVEHSLRAAREGMHK